MNPDDPNPYAPLPPPTDFERREGHRSFCALQPRWFTWDRFYKFYITDQAVYGGWLGGQMYDKRSTRRQLAPLILLSEPIAIWYDHRRRRLEHLYDGLIEDPLSFMAADRRNLCVQRRDLTEVRLSHRDGPWRWWTMGTTKGMIQFMVGSARRLRILLNDAKGMDAIASDLAAAGYPVLDPEKGSAR